MDVTEAQKAVSDAAQTLKAATVQRDERIAAAYRSGITAIAISEQTGLSRQQIHRIVASHPAANVEALRREVMDSEARYEDLIEDDQVFVDYEVGKLARERGITIT